MDYLLVIFVVVSNIYFSNGILPGFLEPQCFKGDIIQNDKTKCICIDKNIFECFTITSRTKIVGESNQIPTNYLKIKSYNDTTYKDTKDIKNITACIPNAIYVQGNTTCVCTPKGTWPHRRCLKLFGTLLNNPKNYIKCTPNSYVVVECNVCYCNNEGRIDKSRCTNKECNKETLQLTRKNLENNCELKTWYSLSPCQFCYCAEANKLVCSTGKYNSKILELGTYNLTVCGSKLFEEAMELMPEEKRLRNNAVSPKPKNTKNAIPFSEYWNIKETTEDTRFSTITQKGKHEESYSESEEENIYASNKTSQSGTRQILSENEENIPTYDNHNEQDIERQNEENMNKTYDRQNSMQEDDKVNREQYIEDTEFNAHPKSKSYDTDDPITYNKKYDETGPLLTIQIPNVISEVLNLRRSKDNTTVILKETKTKPCKPGIMSFEGCNKCFCLKTGKLLCTDISDC